VLRFRERLLSSQPYIKEVQQHLLRSKHVWLYNFNTYDATNQRQ